MKTNPLKSLMNPKSIAIVGASNNPTKMGTMHAMSILYDGYKGDLYPVHPKEATVLGIKAYASVHDLPVTPDLAFLVVPSDPVPQLLEEFGQLGTKYAVIICAGFKETGTQGQELEAKIKEIAAKYNMRFVGPNCMGIINTEISLNTTVCACDMGPGKLGFASQSGTYITQTLPYLEKRGIRFSKAVSVGNEASIDLNDVLEYLGDDEQTKAISIYIEGIRDIPRFLNIARKITPNKPVIAQYIGGSEAGARSGLSHTGAMAGPDYLYDGLFKQAGIIRVDSIEDLYSYGWALAVLPELKGNKIGIITNSGGPGSAIANTCENGGLEIRTFSNDLQEKIKPLIASHSPCGNPVDLTFHNDMDVLSEKLPELIIKSNETDGIIIHGAMSTGFLISKYPHLQKMLNNVPLETLMVHSKKDITNDVNIPHKYNFPIVISSFFGREDNYTEAYQDNNVAVLDSPEKASTAMVTLYKYKKITERDKYDPPVIPDTSPESLKIIEAVKEKGQKALDEHSAKLLLSSYGIPVVKEKIISGEDEIEKAVADLAYPLVLKICDPEILHKTEKGLVYLNQKNLDEVVKSFRAIKNSAGENAKVLIYEMVMGDREFLAGVSRVMDTVNTVLFGLGGVFTEALKDTSIRLAPLSISESEEMIFDIKADKFLKEFRGMPHVDIPALASLLQKLSFIAVLHEDIAEIDLNPIIISGSQPVVVDALVVLK